MLPPISMPAPPPPPPPTSSSSLRAERSGPGFARRLTLSEVVTDILKTVRTTARDRLLTIRGRVSEDVIRDALKKKE